MITKLLKIIIRKLTAIFTIIKLVSFVGLAFCIWMCIHYYIQHYPNAEITSKPMDYFGMIVGFFTIMVTLLIGWNIYNTIKVKDEFESLKNLKEETKKEVDKAINRISRELWYLAPVFLSAHNDFLHRFETNLNIFSALDHDSILAKSLSREFLLQSLMGVVKLPSLEQNRIIKSIKNKCDKKAIEILYSEFYTFSDEERNGIYKGLNNLFLELLKD